MSEQPPQIDTKATDLAAAGAQAPGAQAAEVKPVDAAQWTRQELERAWPLDPVPAGRAVLMRIRDLNKRFGPRHILRGIDIDVYKGETLVILGGSGSGKTTVIRHLLGFLTSDA